MAKGIYLTNPELTIEDVTITTKYAPMGPRPGQPFPCGVTDSGLLHVSAVGDPGDLVQQYSHDVEIVGGQKRPRYIPYDTSGVNALRCTPNSINTMTNTNLVSNAATTTLVVADDRLFYITAVGTLLNVNCWDGSSWDLKASITINTAWDISACSIGQNIYIVLAETSNKVISLYLYNTLSATLALLDEGLIGPANLVKTVALATSGSTFVLLAQYWNADISPSGAQDVWVYFGGISDLQLHDQTLYEKFGALWGYTQIVAPTITYNSLYGFIAAVTANNSNRAVKILTSKDGTKWKELRNIDGDVSQPDPTSPQTTRYWSSSYLGGEAYGRQMAIACENRRIYVWRWTNLNTVDGDPTSLMMRFFAPRESGTDHDWFIGETAVSDVAASTATRVTACNWRGTLYWTWLNYLNLPLVRKGNVLSTSGTREREMILGEPNFVTGLDDDSGTALWFIPTGTVRAGDRYRIPPTEYDYAAEHVLDDFMQRVWRGNYTQAQEVIFDAGVNRLFAVDTVALFGTNMPIVQFQMSENSNFSSYVVNQQISAEVAYANISSVDRSVILFPNNTFEPHAFAPGAAKYFASFSGTFLPILDNDDRRIFVDGSAQGAAGRCGIFRSSMGYLFAKSSNYRARYMKFITPAIAIPPAPVACEIARVLVGIRFEPTVDYRIGWGKGRQQQINRVELPDGSRFNTLGNYLQRQSWQLTYKNTLENVRPMENFFGRTAGGVKLFAFWPDPSSLSGGNEPNVYPMYFTTEPTKMTDVGSGVVELAVSVEGQI